MKTMFKFLAKSSADEVPVAAPPADSAQPGRSARQELLTAISTFLTTHDLDVTPANLALAHAAFSGADLDLGRRITAREISGEAITQAWLDQQRPAGHDEGEAERAETEAMMVRLDSSLATFAAATSRAEGATAAYGASLTQQVGRISHAAAPGDIVANLVDITRAMLERTRDIEQEMKKSSQEADSLRQSLERARRDAEIDHLTGLPNRRAFEGVLEREYRAAQQDIDLLSVAFCDIDHFKQVNDVHGHETGDRVIQAIGQVLARISDDRCHVARHGGEEFVVLLRGRSVDEAKSILDSAREQLAERRFVNRTTDEPIGRITFSAGVANVFASSEPRDALAAADEALYRAKAEGRNRICIASR